jgi:L-threonylcarbamoyladenylate synthase
MGSFETVIIEAASERVVPEALAILAADGLVAFPTDTIYGLGARLTSRLAVGRLYAVKGRPADRPIPVLLSAASQLDLVSHHPPDALVELGQRFWPGPLTLVLPKANWIPDEVSQGSTLGVRVPAHPFALQLLESTGPLAVTSANRSGGEICRTANQVESQLGGQIEMIVDGGETPGEKASTVVAWAEGTLQVLRQGPLSRQDLQSALSSG